MSRICKLFIFLLVINTTACVSDYLSINTANGEDEDIGLGGTGLLASTESGLGGTGIIGEITGFGSIFVNGIEIEYNNETPFTVNGKESAFQQLEIGDVIEILTIDSSNHTQAQKINLRHEVIGKVESVNQETFSYTVQGQTIIQNKGTLPKIGATVAVSGIRIDEQTIMSTRTTTTNVEKPLLRLHTELPFKEQASRWSLQMHFKNGSATIITDGQTKILGADNKLPESSKNLSTIKIIQLHKTDAGQIKIDRVVSPLEIPRGQESPIHKKKYNKTQKSRRSQPRAIRGLR